MPHIDIHPYHSPVGEIILGSYRGALCLADWQHRTTRTQIDKRIQRILHASYQHNPRNKCPIIEHAIQELSEYFSQQRREFSVPIQTVGTDFQCRVWESLSTISYGKTTSYLSIAKRMNKPKAVRAVANAVGANALSIFIPCHRVIGTNGRLVGYAGGLPTKTHLLALEAINH